MNISTRFCIAGLVVSILAGCQSQPVTLSAVGPAPATSERQVTSGYLRVFSATETHMDGDIAYNPHKGYRILSDSGKMLHYVNNHIGTMDESPSIVTIPAGHYQIVADAEGYGRVTVPVEIRGGKTTVIHLERNWKPTPGATGNLVRLPGGEAVGWSAAAN